MFVLRAVRIENCYLLTPVGGALTNER